MTFEDFLNFNQIRLVFETLPYSIKGFCRKKDGWIVIVLNARCDRDEQKKAFDHELAHALKGHLDMCDYEEHESAVAFQSGQRKKKG